MVVETKADLAKFIEQEIKKSNPLATETSIRSITNSILSVVKTKEGVKAFMKAYENGK